jgi:hypothetical protein
MEKEKVRKSEEKYSYLVCVVIELPIGLMWGGESHSRVTCLPCSVRTVALLYVLTVISKYVKVPPC